MRRTFYYLTILAGWLVGLKAPVAAQGAFFEGQRWQMDWDDSIPRAVATTGFGEWSWSVAPGPAVRLVGQGAGLEATVLREWSADGALGSSLEVLTAGDSDALFALWQVPDPDALHRRTIVARFDATQPGALQPVWQHDLGLSANGRGLLRGDGDGLVAVAFDSARGRVTARWIDPADGSAQATQEWGASSLGGAAASAGAQRVAVISSTSLTVLDRAAGVLFDTSLGVAREAIALSADGDTLAAGALDGIRFWREGVGGYQSVGLVASLAGEFATRAALDATGSTLAAAFWNSAGDPEVRFGMWNVPDGAPHQTIAPPRARSGLQAFPSSVALSPDGQRAAFGSWGDGGAEPELWLLDRDDANPLLAVDVGGSVLSVAMSADGTRVDCATKAGHAGVLGSAGSVQRYDSGERDLELTRTPVVGGELELAMKANGHTHGWFVFAHAVPSGPVAVAGVLGTLGVEPGSVFLLTPGVRQSSQVISLGLPLAASPALVGLSAFVQGLTLSPGPVLSATLSTSVVRPQVL